MEKENRFCLALEGGEPVSKESIPYHRPTIGKPEIEAAKRSIESKYIVGPGPHCEKLERELEEAWNVPRVLTVTSCTHAMELALLTAELPENAEIIVPTFTYVSSAQAVLRAGAIPVFADVDPETGMLTKETIEDARSKDTAGVMMVHYGGFPGDMEAVKTFCQKHGLFSLEDAAQAYGSSRDGHPAGTVGRFGAISFHGTKSITCGEGGILILNEEDDVSRAEMIRDKGTDRSATRLGDVDRYTWRTIGSSYVLSDILGAILREQIQRWSERKKNRLSIQNTLRTGIRKIDSDNIFDWIEPEDGVEENGHITGFLLPSPEHRDWLLTALHAEGVEAREHYHPLHKSPYAREHLPTDRDFPGANHFSGSVVRLPAYPDLTRQQIKQIIRAVEKIYPHLLDKI